jgi:signal transduction histidine kinase
MAEVAHAFNSMAERLEKAESLRRNLLADVAHELRNPLHVLQGNLQAILDGVYPLEGEEIGRLLTHTQHLNSLVNDLHELAQAEAKQLPLYKSEVNVAELVKETAATFHPSAVAKEIGLQVELLGKHPIVLVDKVRLRQVVSNLLNNALHYTAVGGRVQISVAQEGGLVVVRVADSGDGIAAEELPYVFDRFYRADKSRQRDYGHTGLGLAIVKAIVEAHGGEVAAESGGAGRGSTFVVRLPVKSDK